jgi:hypothetical protein
MKKFILLLTIFIIILFSASECYDEYEGTADEKLQRQTEQSMKEANSQIGMPAIKNFQERKLAKMIFELRDQEDFICYAYLVNVMNGSIGQFIGKCIGYGLPYSVQYTNPEKIVDDPHGGIDSGSRVIPQPDPNGLFMPSGLSATWLMLIDPATNEPRPVYIEPEIIVSPFKLK